MLSLARGRRLPVRHRWHADALARPDPSLCIHRALLDVYGVETTIDGIPYHGKTDPGILRAALERLNIPTRLIDSKMPAALDVVRRDAAEKADRFRPNVLPGIRDLVTLLKDSGKLLGICSGNLEAVAWLKLKAAGLAEYFEFGCFADECELRVDVFRKGMQEVAKRLGPAAKVCFIGDTPEDVRAAQAPAATSSPSALAFLRSKTWPRTIPTPPSSLALNY